MRSARAPRPPIYVYAYTYMRGPVARPRLCLFVFGFLALILCEVSRTPTTQSVGQSKGESIVSKYCKSTSVRSTQDCDPRHCTELQIGFIHTGDTREGVHLCTVYTYIYPYICIFSREALLLPSSFSSREEARSKRPKALLRVENFTHPPPFSTAARGPAALCGSSGAARTLQRPSRTGRS